MAVPNEITMDSMKFAIMTRTKYANAPGDGGASRRRDTEGVTSMRDNRTPNSTTESIPYGYCHCGCGEKTNIAPTTDSRMGHVAGEPYRFVFNHHRKKHRAVRWSEKHNCFLIPLTRGAEAMVDADDLHLIEGRSWQCNDKGYAQAKVGGKMVSMHRVIMPPPPGMVVDHINHNRLDNRRANLRICTYKENGRNRKGANSGSLSSYLGVSQNYRTGKWVAQIKVNGDVHHLGTYDSEKDAARAYDVAASAYFGEFASKNFASGDQ